MAALLLVAGLAVSPASAAHETPPPSPEEQLTSQLVDGPSDYDTNLGLLRAASVRNANHDDSPFRATPSDGLVVEDHLGPRSDYLGNPGGNPEESFPVAAGGQFRTACEFSHFAYDDPLVFPNQPGAAHLHMFFGNTDANALSTHDSLINTGSSTCNGQELNRTGYWAPAMFDAAGDVRVPERIVVYYKGENLTQGNAIAYPPGAAMITPVDLHTVPTSSGGAEGIKYSFTCSDNYSSPGPGANTIPVCDGNQFTSGDPRTVLEVNIKFPQCWNRQDPSNPDNFAAPTSGDWYVSDCGGGQNLPNLEYFINYPVEAGETTDGWFLSSDIDPETGELSGPAGGSLHADWWGGWHPTVNQTWIDNCVNYANPTGAASGCGMGYLSDGGPNGQTPVDGPALRMRPQYNGPIKVDAAQLLAELCPVPARTFAQPADAAYCTPGTSHNHDPAGSTPTAPTPPTGGVDEAPTVCPAPPTIATPAPELLEGPTAVPGPPTSSPMPGTATNDSDYDEAGTDGWPSPPQVGDVDHDHGGDPDEVSTDAVADPPVLAQPNPTTVTQPVLVPPAGNGSVLEVDSAASWDAAVGRAQPGDTIKLTATINSTLTYNGPQAPAGKQAGRDGTAGRPITITAAPGVWIDPGDLHNNVPALDLVGTTHVHVNGINVRGSQFGIRAQHVTGTETAPVIVANNTVTDVGHAGIHIGGDVYDHTPSSYVRVEANTITRTGRTAPQYGEGIYLGYGGQEWVDQSHHLTVTGNQISETTAEGVEIKPGTKHVLVTGNEIHDLSPINGGAISAHYVNETPNPDPATPSDIMITDNRIWNVNLDGRQGANDWAIWVGHGGVTIENNAIWGMRNNPGSTRAVRVRGRADFGPHPVIIRNNLFWTATGWAAEGSPAPTNIQAAGNQGPPGTQGTETTKQIGTGAAELGASGPADNGTGPGSALGVTPPSGPISESQAGNPCPDSPERGLS